MIEAALDGIAALPDVTVADVEREVQAGDSTIDRLVQVYVNGMPLQLAIEAKASGYPRDEERAASQLEWFLEAGHGAAVGLMIAPHITDHARAMLRARSIGYWDESGSLYLRTRYGVFDIERPQRRGQRALPKRLFQGHAAQILHALLLDHERDWKVMGLADRANVAPSYAHQVLKALEQAGYVETSGSGPRTYRRITQPGRLLDDWAGQHSLSQYGAEKYYLWVPKGADTAEAVAQAFESSGFEYALTATSGALRRAPFVWQESVVSLLVRAGTDVSKPMSALSARGVDDGENVLILVTRDASPLMFRQRVDDLWLASDIQLYLDLSVWPQRGKEQAAHLRGERLGF